MEDEKAKDLRSQVPTSEELVRTMGQVTWLLTLSKDHRDKPISFVESHVTTPLMFKQVRVYTKGKQPLAAVVWAYVSPEVKEKIAAGDYKMTLQDWRSGPEVVVVECISPFLEPSVFTDQFMKQVEALQRA